MRNVRDGGPESAEYRTQGEKPDFLQSNFFRNTAGDKASITAIGKQSVLGKILVEILAGLRDRLSHQIK